MEEMEKLREQAQRRKREERTGQSEILFVTEGDMESRHYVTLREHYLTLAREAVLGRLRQRGRISYDDTWTRALGFPLVWESDLRDWIQDWQQAEHLQLEGLVGRERVPKRGHPHFLVWREKRD